MPAVSADIVRRGVGFFIRFLFRFIREGSIGHPLFGRLQSKWSLVTGDLFATWAKSLHQRIKQKERP
jgi:hypothetical protein